MSFLEKLGLTFVLFLAVATLLLRALVDVLPAFSLGLIALVWIISAVGCLVFLLIRIWA